MARRMTATSSTTNTVGFADLTETAARIIGAVETVIEGKTEEIRLAPMLTPVRAVGLRTHRPIRLHPRAECALARRLQAMRRIMVYLRHQDANDR